MLETIFNYVGSSVDGVKADVLLAIVGVLACLVILFCLRYLKNILSAVGSGSSMFISNKNDETNERDITK